MNVNEFVHEYVHGSLDYLQERYTESFANIPETLTSYLEEAQEYTNNLNYHSLINLVLQSVKPFGNDLKREARAIYNYIWSHVPSELYNLLSMYDKCLAYLFDLRDEIRRDINSHRLLLESMPERLYQDGSIYLQDFRLNLEELRVDYTEHKYQDGSIYYGSYLNRKREGLGAYKWTNGDLYIGHWEFGKMHRGGIFLWSNGDLYIGNWQHGKISGLGIKVMNNNDLFIGYWVDDEAQGIGLKFFHAGDMHFGLYSNDKRNGLGIYRWNNSDLYVGNWRNGKMAGTGVKTMADGSGYIGHWSEDLASGLGVKIFQVDLHLGYYEDDNRDGYGVYVWNVRGDIYAGDWERGVQEGEGTYFYGSSTRYYMGEWSRGRKNGIGIYRDGRQYFREEWTDGSRVDFTPIDVATATRETSMPSLTLRRLEDSKELTEDVWWQFVCRVDELDRKELYPLFRSLLRELTSLESDRVLTVMALFEDMMEMTDEELDEYSKQELCTIIQYLWEEWVLINEETHCDNAEFTIAGKELTDEYNPDELIVVEQGGYNYCFLGSELLANTEKNPYTNVEFSREDQAMIRQRLKHLFRTHVKYGTERETTIPVVFSHLQALFSRLEIESEIPRVESLSKEQLKGLMGRVYSALLLFYSGKSTDERKVITMTSFYERIKDNPDIFKLNTWLKYVVDKNPQAGQVIASKITEYLDSIGATATQRPERMLEQKEERPIARAYRLIAESLGSSVLDYTRLDEFSLELRRDIVVYINLARQDAGTVDDRDLYYRAEDYPTLDNIGEWLLDIYTRNNEETLERLSNTLESVLNRDEATVRAIVR